MRDCRNACIALSRLPGEAILIPLAYHYVFPALWLSWVVYWWVAARDVKSTAQRESLPSRLSHIVPLAIAVLLYSRQRVRTPLLAEHFLPSTEWSFWIGVLLTAGGLLFTVWARLHLGRNWSGSVTIKEGHELVTSGPYALVRHPIYTGLLLALLGSTLALGDLRAVLAFALAAGALWHKLRIEERWMRQQFGDAYQAYSRRVAALIPFVL
jgi:protein-S-isoprenylcysteine O-methyltransferase Ste14